MTKEKNLDPIEQALSILGKARRGSERASVEVIPTEIKEFNDSILGCGGLPRGKVIELYSAESVGKSTLAYWLIGQVQKAGGNAALFDAEGAYLPKYGEACGINNDRLILPEFDLGEDALFKVRLLLATNTMDLIVVDSMPSLQPKLAAQQISGELLKMNQRLERAKMFTIFFNDLSGGYNIKPEGKNQKNIRALDGTDLHKIYNTKTCLIMINHAKKKIGVMFGERIYTPGGDAINFISSIRIGMDYIRKSKERDKNKLPIYKVIKIKAVKNKLAPPLCEFNIKMLRAGGIEPLSKESDDIEELSIEDDTFIREMNTEKE